MFSGHDMIHFAAFISHLGNFQEGFEGFIIYESFSMFAMHQIQGVFYYTGGKLSGALPFFPHGSQIIFRVR